MSSPSRLGPTRPQGGGPTPSQPAPSQPQDGISGRHQPTQMSQDSISRLPNPEPKTPQGGPLTPSQVPKPSQVGHTLSNPAPMQPEVDISGRSQPVLTQPESGISGPLKRAPKPSEGGPPCAIANCAKALTGSDSISASIGATTGQYFGPTSANANATTAS